MAHISKIGKYDIVDVLGEGAMGVVYRAVDPVLGREVAIKVMNDALARDEDFRTRFLREARAAGSLQHPNVITVYDCGEVDADLEQLMGESTPLTTTNKIEIIIGVLNALSYAHKRGIVHRDIKPANIRVNEEGRALIMDFGIAHIQSSNMMKTGMMVETSFSMTAMFRSGDLRVTWDPVNCPLTVAGPIESSGRRFKRGAGCRSPWRRTPCGSRGARRTTTTRPAGSRAASSTRRSGRATRSIQPIGSRRCLPQ